jgi:hypothetical protein
MSGLIFNNKRPLIVVGIDGTSNEEWMWDPNRTDEFRGRDVGKPFGGNSHVYRMLQEVRTKEVDKRFFYGPSDYLSGQHTEVALDYAKQFVMERLRHYFPDKLNGKNALRMPHISPYFNHSQTGREGTSMTAKEKNQQYARNVQSAYDVYGTRTHAKTTYQPVNPFEEGPSKLMTSFENNNQPLTIDDVWVVLIGHSRGCVATVELAKLLSPIVKVFWMGMFDAVDRQPNLYSEKIQNVRTVFHAMRNNPDAKGADLDPANPKNENIMNSRNPFSHTATQYDPSFTKYTARVFHTSHGGVGGDINTASSGYMNKYLNAGTDTACVPDQYSTVDVMDELGYVVGQRTVRTKSSHYNEELLGKIQKGRFKGMSVDQVCRIQMNEAYAWMIDSARLNALPVQ